MKQKYWVIIFIIVLLGDLIGIQLDNNWLQITCKPLLIPILAGFLFSGIAGKSTTLAKWLYLALFFSFAGDVLLMFQSNNELFFLFGLSAFLLAHVFYIIFFHQIRLKEQVVSNPWLLVIVVIYYAILISLLSPYLGAMKYPVRIYGIVISFMFMLAMHMYYIKNKRAGVWMLTGALLFVISDSLLAINKFYSSFPAADILVMLTYGLAQLSIISGAISYIKAAEKS